MVTSPKLPVGALQLVQRGGDEPRPGRADRVADRDRAAVRVHPRQVGVQLALPRQHDRGEGLVDLDRVHVVHAHAGPVEQPLGRVDRSGEHQHGVDADEALVDDAGPRREAELPRPGRPTSSSTAAAPSVICDDVPAVWTPSGRATGFSAASASSEVSRRPSSRATWCVVPVGLPSSRSGASIGTTSRSKRPSAHAACGALLGLQPETVAVRPG